jgi:GTP-binding protein
MLPVVAIVGRPNVGKSSLFNRIVRKRRAIESDISGTTRDQISHRVKLFKHEVLLVDTGGLELDQEGVIEEDVQSQAQAAIEGADLILFVVDVRHEPTALDFHAADLLRKSGKPCVLIANKCDHVSRLEEKTFNFYEFGFGDPVAVSAIHGTGLDALKARTEDELGSAGFEPHSEEVEDRLPGLRLAFVGRPNVGKSSMVNALFGKEKVIVSNVPGTTRDSVEAPFEYNGTDFVLVDTAGLRRRGKIEKGIEKYSVMRSLQAIDDADVVVLMMDGSEGIFSQDLHVCEFILAENKGLVIVLNKTDLFEDQEAERNRLVRILRHRMAFVPWAPVIFTSAQDRKNIFAVLDVAQQIGEERQREIPQLELDFWLDEAITRHMSAGGKGKRRTRVLSVEQTGTNPPQFTFLVEHPNYMHFSYQRYLENSIRDRFGFGGTGMKLIFKRANSRRKRAGQPRSS